MALRRSHFQCGKCEGRRSQSSVARTPSLALPPRWARKYFFVVVCAALLTFVCMLRYSEWNVVPIWVLYSSIFIVVRYADLIPGFFSAYRGTLCRSGSGILRYLQWYVGPIWGPDSSVLIVVRCADLGLGFFSTYATTLRQFSFWTLRYLYCCSAPIQFLDSSVLILLLCANLVFGLFGTYTAALYQFSFWILWYLYCCTIPTWYIVFDALGPGRTPCLLSAFIPCPGCLSVG